MKEKTTKTNLKRKEVKMMKKILLSLLLLFLLALSTQAQAAIIVDNWTINLNGIDGIVMPTSIGAVPPPPLGINQIIFSGVSHSEIVVNAGPLGTSVGDISMFDAHLGASSFKFNSGVQGPGPLPGLNIGYELTFDVTDVVRVISVDPVTGTFTFAHLPAGTYGGQTSDNFLEIWVDNLTNMGGTQANTVTGNGYSDGVMVARLINPAEPTDGGSFAPLGLDGSDDAIFKLNKLLCPTCFMLPGIFFGDTNGDGILEDLSQYNGLVGNFMASAVITDNNFDADADNDGIPDTAAPTNWATFFPTRLSTFPTGLYASNDGSASAAYQVPEPSTMFLCGLGLLGLALYRRRK